MLKWSLIFAVLALLFGVLGFGFLQGVAKAVALVLLAIFLIALLVALITGRRVV